MILADVLTWLTWERVALGVGVGLVILAVLEERRRTPDDPVDAYMRERQERERNL